MKSLFLALFLAILATTVSAQSEPKLNSELELKRQILILQVQLKDERAKNAKITTAYGQCAEAVADAFKLDPLFAQFKADVESANPGYTYDVEKGTFTKKPDVKDETSTVPAVKK